MNSLRIPLGQCRRDAAGRCVKHTEDASDSFEEYSLDAVFEKTEENAKLCFDTRHNSKMQCTERLYTHRSIVKKCGIRIYIIRMRFIRVANMLWMLNML